VGEKVDLEFVELRVPRLEEVAGFYRDIVGVDLRADAHPSDSVKHYEVEWQVPGNPGSPLSFVVWGAVEGDSARLRVGFKVDDLDATFARAERAGVTVLQKPTVRPWGRQAIFKDPDGNLVSVVQR
jgi:predicted enzyme related to lactoylglutathione lyase